jgi:ATP/maltotriose-dependent transcriptional regulator MalT
VIASSASLKAFEAAQKRFYLRSADETPKGMYVSLYSHGRQWISIREMEVLVLVARGLSNGQIASTLMVSEATVKRHLANAYPKMGVSSRARP